MKSYTKTFLYSTTNSVKPLYLIINKWLHNENKKRNGNKYLTLVSIDENRDMLKKYEGL